MGSASNDQDLERFAHELHQCESSPSGRNQFRCMGCGVTRQVVNKTRYDLCPAAAARESAKFKADLARVTAERDALQKFNRDHVVTLECPCCGDEGAAAQFFIEDQETFCGCGGIVAVGGDPEDNAYISLNECINPAHRGEEST